MCHENITSGKDYEIINQICPSPCPFGFVIPLALLSLGNSLDLTPDTRAFQFVFFKVLFITFHFKKAFIQKQCIVAFQIST